MRFCTSRRIRLLAPISRKIQYSVKVSSSYCNKTHIWNKIPEHMLPLVENSHRRAAPLPHSSSIQFLRHDISERAQSEVNHAET